MNGPDLDSMDVEQLRTELDAARRTIRMLHGQVEGMRFAARQTAHMNRTAGAP